MKEAEKRLEELVNLKDNWDGYGGIPVKPKNADYALEILKQVYDPSFPSPHIVPSNNGGLQIEWYTAIGEIQLYITAPYKVNFYTEIYASDTDLTSDFAQVKDALHCLIKNEKK